MPCFGAPACRVFPDHEEETPGVSAASPFERGDEEQGSSGGRATRSIDSEGTGTGSSGNRNRVELMRQASREGKAPQRDVTAVDDDPRCEFNLKLEPAIKAGSGVKATAVDSGQAAACAAFLQQQWRGSARFGLNGIYLGGQQCQGYASYPKTLLEHDAEEQASHTLLISNALLPLYREKCPGFEPMEQQLVAWLAEEFGFVAELANG